MVNKISNVLLAALLSVALCAATTAHAADAHGPEQVVAELQKLPQSAMFCDSEPSEDSSDEAQFNPEEVFKKYFSKEFYKLFMWTECDDPDFPPKLNFFLYDIRNAMPHDEGFRGRDTRLKNYRFKIIGYQGNDKVIVGMSYRFGTIPLFASYTLIREGGQWKIDDIALQGDNASQDPIAYGNDSIKGTMQYFYHNAEERYRIDHPDADLASLKQMMDTFRGLPYYELFCKDEKWKPLEPTKFRAELEAYFSKEFYELFSWSQCGEPAVPPRYKEIESEIPWDIRYGVEYMPDTGAALYAVKRAETVHEYSIVDLRKLGPDKAVYTLGFEIGALDDQWSDDEKATFTLIREGGKWKIDDVVLGNGHMHEADRRQNKARADSIKTDMQTRYHAAEERYQKEQATKGAATTP